MRTIKQQIFKFSELSSDVQKKVLEAMRNDSYMYMPEELCIAEEAKECLELIGFESPKIRYSVSWSQGDYAGFSSERYSYSKQARKKILKHFGIKEVPDNDDDIISALCFLADELQEIQRVNFWQMRFMVIEHRGKTGIETVYFENIREQVETDIREAIKRFNHALYRCFSKELEYYSSDEYITETIEANDYEFYANGDLFIE